MVCRVLHGDEGGVHVYCWQNEQNVPGIPAYRGKIDVPSGVLTLGDAVGERTVRADVGAGTHDVAVYIDRPAEATRVDVVLS